jgi:molybdate transport system substrate-binding protein
MAKPFRGRSFSWSAALLAALAVLATPGPAASAEPAPRKLAVAASANLRLALVEIAGAFERRNPGVKVEPTFGATGALQAQIQGGSPFDLFLGADRASADRLQAAGLARGEPFHYANGKLVLWIANPARVDPGVLGLAAVSNPGVKKIAIANPELAPYGAAAEEALRSAGILDTTRPKFVVAESVVQVVQLATGGSAQAAFVPWSFVLVPPLAAQGRYVTVPAGAYKPILQHGVVLSGARDPRLAEEFVAFLRGPSGRTILERHKYALPPN